MITIEKRLSRERYMPPIDDWEFLEIYSDRMEGGDQREKDYANYMKTKDDGVYEYKITVK